MKMNGLKNLRDKKQQGKASQQLLLARDIEKIASLQVADGSTLAFPIPSAWRQEGLWSWFLGAVSLAAITKKVVLGNKLLGVLKKVGSETIRVTFVVCVFIFISNYAINKSINE